MPTDMLSGARNLLLNCVGARPGDRILLVGEAVDAPYFAPALCEQVSNIAIGNVVSAFEHLNIGLRLMPEESRSPDPRIPVSSLLRRHDNAP